jgi:hypothetical protein
MRSIRERSAVSSPVLVRDPLAKDLVGAFSRKGTASVTLPLARTDGASRWFRSGGGGGVRSDRDQSTFPTDRG